MSKLTIHLQDGFSADDVTISVNGDGVYNNPAVTSELQTGFADSLDVDVPQDTVHCEIRLAAKGLVGAIRLNIRADVHLGVSLTPDSGFHYWISDEPFGYV